MIGTSVTSLRIIEGPFLGLGVLADLGTGGRGCDSAVARRTGRFACRTGSSRTSISPAGVARDNNPFE